MTTGERTRRQFIKELGLLAASPMMPGIGRMADFLAPRASTERPLTPEEEKRLYEESLKYQAFSMEETIRVGKLINWIPGNEFEWPNNMCGPLAIIQMVKAGLLPESTSVADFWLLNPRVNQRLLEKTFPRDKCEWFKTETPLADFDFRTTPLFPGDFVYTFGGSFEHMLTVSRIDDQGRIFAVTNLLTGGKYKGRDEFTIKEVMLYDPSNPGIGQFYDWKYGKDRNRLGRTGTAGFAYWRRKAGGEAGVPVEVGSDFAKQLESVLTRNGGEWHVAIRNISDVGDIDVFVKDEMAAIHPASVIKVPIAMLFMAWAEKEKDGLAKTLARGVGGRSFEQLLFAMLVKSEEEATKALADFVEKNLSGGSRQTLTGWKVGDISISPRRTTAKAMTDIFEDLYRGKLIGEQGRTKILELMGTYTEGDDDRLGKIAKVLPNGWGVKVWNKRGSIAEGMVVVVDAAIVEFSTPKSEKKAYVVEFFGYPGEGATYQSLHDTIGEAAVLFAGAVTTGKIY